MGRSGQPPAARADSKSDGGDPSRSVICLSSSDDDEANKELRLEIEARSREGELKRKRDDDGEVIAISPDSSEDKNQKKKSNRRRRRKRKQMEVKAAAAGTEAVDGVHKEVESVGTAEPVITEANEVNGNVILRKLLRGPRYFDPGASYSGACFNCHDDSHTAVDCNPKKRKKPCFFCGMFGHDAKRCTQRRDCFMCKRRGHIAINCPDRHNSPTQDYFICLRCGDLGHDMGSCKHEYAPDDLKEIKCYVCKKYGHLCCVDFVDNGKGPREVSCYNCAQSGHDGPSCGEMIDYVTPTLCYKCGGEGHFASGCTKKEKKKFGRREGGSSTPRMVGNENMDSLGHRLVPCDHGKACKEKKKMIQYEDWFENRLSMTSSKPQDSWCPDC